MSGHRNAAYSATTVLLATAVLLSASCMVTAPTVDPTWYDVPDDYPEASVSPDDVTRYEALLAEATDPGYPGIAMLIDGPDGFWASAGGLADIAHGVEMRANSLFKIGSVTKTYTAALILDLEEDGLLDIDDAIATYLPEEMVTKIANADQISIRQLLNHTSGIPSYFGFTISGIDYASEHLNHFTDFNQTKEELVSYVYGWPADFSPGDDWNYSNTNYVLLALIAEYATGLTYGELLEERQFIPLDLDHTYLESESSIPGLARGYDAFFGDNRLYDVSRDVSGIGGDGGIITNTYDLTKFYRAIFDLQLFGQEQLDEMRTQYPFNTWGSDPINTSGYTLGMFFEATDGIARYYAHYGYVYGYGADAYYFTRTDTMVVILSNMTNNPRAGENTWPLRELMWSFE